MSTRQAETVDDILGDVWDTRELIDLIDRLKYDLAALTCDECGSEFVADEPCPSGHDESDHHLNDEHEGLAAELSRAETLAGELEGYAPDFHYGETVIADDYFTTYAELLADDIGAIDKDASWPTAYIDWEAAADALKMDYSAVEFEGVTYWVR